MNTVDDIGYGREFAHFYDRIFPKDATAERTADVLAGMHPGNGPALELGVGTGRIAIPLARRVGPVVGVDSSVEMLDRLRSDIARPGATRRVVPPSSASASRSRAISSCSASYRAAWAASAARRRRRWSLSVPPTAGPSSSRSSTAVPTVSRSSLSWLATTTAPG